MKENLQVSKDLRALREVWGYSAESVAEYLSISEGELWSIENEGKFVFDDVIKLCDLYGVKFEELLYGKEPPIPFNMRWYAAKDLQRIAYANKIFMNFVEMIDIAEELKK